MSRIRVALIGFGPIGRSVGQEVLAAPDLDLVAVVDPAPDLTGRSVAELLDNPLAARRKVLASLDALPARVDVAVHLAASRFPVAERHITELVQRRLPVVTTCEEMLAARWRWPRPAAKLDRAAREAGVPVIATGVNPGFVMDLLPAALANVLVSIRSVKVTRRVNTAKRRKALQEKTGAGITRAEFRARAAQGTVGHVGLKDSLVFLMNHLPLQGEVGDEKLTAVLQKDTRGRIPKGHVLGVHQVVKARDGDGRVVATLDLTMVHGLEDAYDEIRIAGDPPAVLRFEGGLPGDRATVGAVLAAIRWVESAPPGLG
jgi:4-hydroxy-tetrahydrodipicolinate reductase